MTAQPITVVTGANSGIGRATALHLAEHGHVVYGTVRSTSRAAKLLDAAEELGVGIELVELDIADDDSVRDGFAEVLQRAGRVDHLINNAGVGGNGVVEEITSERLLDVLNIDVMGAIRCIKAVLPGMRDRGTGTIVNVTSIVGRIGAIAQGSYVAAKWALEGLGEQLAVEVAPFGVRVAIIEPGVTKSSIFAKNTDTPNESGVYDEQYARMGQMYAAGRIHASDAAEVAEAIHTAIHTDAPKLRYPVSWGGAGIAGGRAAMSDEEWVALGHAPSLEEYIAEFGRHFGVDIST